MGHDGTPMERGKSEFIVDRTTGRQVISKYSSREASRAKSNRVSQAAVLIIVALLSSGVWAGGREALATAEAAQTGVQAVVPIESPSAEAYKGTTSSSVSGTVDAPQAITNLQVALDARQTLLGPTWKIDTPFNTVGTTPNVIGYVSNNTAWAYSTADLFNLTLLPSAALAKGVLPNFDGCGAWMNSTYQDGSLIRAWYHGEVDLPVCTSAPSKKAVGYAESTDGGRTFTKPNYPNNKVISAPSRFTDPEDASEADQHVIRVGNYLYMYFMAGRDYKIRLARSLVSDGGKPGTWWKYYNGSFSEPGLGGESSQIASGSVLGRAWVSYNSSVGEYMGFSWSTTGFGISLSPDGINWRRVTGDVLNTTHQFHNRDSSSPELIDYTSFIGLDGSSVVIGADVWLYYMQVPAGQPVVGNTRYLARQKLHILNGATPPPTSPPAATATSTYTAVSTATSVPYNTPVPSTTATVASTATRTGTGTTTATRTATRTATASPTVIRMYTFVPQIDARVEEANPTRNYGRDSYLRSNGGSEPLVESYMRFAVSGLSGAVQSAKLRVYSYNGTTNGPAIYATGGGWTETGITWNNKPGRTSGAYDDKGALGANTWVEFNITPLVTGDNTYNFSMQQNSVDGFYVYSREGATPPQLVITTR